MLENSTSASYKQVMKLQTVRGTRDICGHEARVFRDIEQHLLTLAPLYNFEEIETPIFESTQVFKRTLGLESDIVHKEMYTFEDRSGDSLTLRPEGTASVARAVVSGGLLRSLPLKFFYSGPMFRHERPQRGRYRQFRQLGVELIGVDQPLADIEVIDFAWNFLTSCGLDKKVQLELNTLGDEQSRRDYKKVLVDYFSKHKNHLSRDSLKRLTSNPLRILDSKDKGDMEIALQAPLFGDFINRQSKDFFQEVTKGLETLKIPYKINPRLVRGLDYYTHTVFEFTTDQLGAQNGVLSGGRYHGLIEQMGGEPGIAGVGWAAGTDRLALLLDIPERNPPSVAVIATEDQTHDLILETLRQLRRNQIPSQPIYSGNLSKRLKKAHKRNCTHALLIGEEELQSGQLSLKYLKTGEQRKISPEALFPLLKSFYESEF